MLFLLFQLGPDRYALEASQVVEVVPLLTLKGLPQAQRGVAGLFNYRGQAVPAVDLSELTLGRPARQRLSTRIIIVNYSGEDGRIHLLGLIAENATGMLRKDEKDFRDTGLNLPGAPYLGGVLMDQKGPIQWINARRLLPDHVRQLLFSNASVSDHATV